MAATSRVMMEASCTASGQRWRVGELLATPLVTGALLTEGLASGERAAATAGLRTLAIRLEAGGEYALAVQARRMVNRARLLPATAQVGVELRRPM